MNHSEIHILILIPNNYEKFGRVGSYGAGWPKELGTAVAKKKKPGDVHFRQDGNMVATLWKDKRPVAVLSTNAQPAMGKQERRAPG